MQVHRHQSSINAGACESNVSVGTLCFNDFSLWYVLQAAWHTADDSAALLA